MMHLGRWTALFATIACSSAYAEEGENKEDQESFSVHIWEADDLWLYSADLLKWLSSESTTHEQEQAKGRELARVLGGLYSLNTADISDILKSPDPALAATIFVWATRLGKDLDAVLDRTPSLEGALHEALRSRTTSSDDARPLGVTPQTGFERALAQIVNKESWTFQDNGGGKVEKDGSDPEWNYYDSLETPGSDDGEAADPDGAERYEIEFWQYAVDPVAPGAAPDRPHYRVTTQTPVNENYDIGKWFTSSKVEAGEPNNDGTSGEPSNGQPSDGQPADGEPADGQPADGEPVDGEPVDGEPVDGEPDDGEPADKETGEGTPDDGGDEEQMPCGDACDENSGDLPEDAEGDSTDGTTQPGSGESSGSPWVVLSRTKSQDPLILVSPEQALSTPISILVRGPAYGLTQPPPFSDGFLERGGSEVHDAVERLLQGGRDIAPRLEARCGTKACAGET